MPSIAIPQALPLSQCVSARFGTRYEDFCQDGRLVLDVLPSGLGPTVWTALASESAPTLRAFEQGVVPILSRLVLEGSSDPFRIGVPFDVMGAYDLAHTRNGDGAVERILLNMWGEFRAPIGRVRGPAPANAGVVGVAGRVFAEHVFTRLFAAPEDRKVVELDLPGVPKVPGHVVAGRKPAAIIELGSDASPLEPGYAPDPAVTSFGLAHTDGNQHVNSLVYLRLFEEAALRRFASLRVGTAVLARWIEIGYRKPFFAGDSVRFHLQAFREDGRLGAVGYVVHENTAASPDSFKGAHAYVKALFEA